MRKLRLEDLKNLMNILTTKVEINYIEPYIYWTNKKLNPHFLTAQRDDRVLLTRGIRDRGLYWVQLALNLKNLLKWGST